MIYAIFFTEARKANIFELFFMVTPNFQNFDFLKMFLDVQVLMQKCESLKYIKYLSQEISPSILENHLQTHRYTFYH